MNSLFIIVPSIRHYL